MRLAVISDIHANLPALEAVLDDDRRRPSSTRLWCLGDVVGYGAQPDECARLVARALRRLPGRQPRPRGARRARHLVLLARRPPPRSAGPARTRRDETLEFLRGPQPADESREVGALPRLAARPGLGVRALARPGGRVHRRARRARSAWSATPTSRSSSRSGRGRREATTDRDPGRPGRRRRDARPRRGPLAGQPRQRRPAARRRPARRLARARHRGLDGHLSPRSTTTSTGPPRRSSSGRPARAPRPSASTSGNEARWTT